MAANRSRGIARSIHSELTTDAVSPDASVSPLTNGFPGGAAIGAAEDSGARVRFQTGSAAARHVEIFELAGSTAKALTLPDVGNPSDMCVGPIARNCTASGATSRCELDNVNAGIAAVPAPWHPANTQAPISEAANQLEYGNLACVCHPERRLLCVILSGGA